MRKFTNLLTLLLLALVATVAKAETVALTPMVSTTWAAANS